MALSSQTRPIVSIVARPYIPSVWIRLAGDLDMAAEHALTEATDRLRAWKLRLIVIDLTAVTFVCSTFANFLCAVYRAHPGAELVLHRPSPLAAVMVTAAELDGIVVMTGVPVPPATRPGTEQAPPASITRPTTATVPGTWTIPEN